MPPYGEDYARTRRAARPLAAGGIDLLHTVSMVPNGPMWAYFVTLRVRPLRVGR